MEPHRWKALFTGEGLKSTHQRLEIFDVFLNSAGHMNLSEIHAQVARRNPKIGFTTVYRTLKLLTRLGLAAERKFEDGETRYEPVRQGTHHDHLICLSCGKIIEFQDEGLESIQNRIAKSHGFKIFHHRMELYGCCKACPSPKSSLEKSEGGRQRP